VDEWGKISIETHIAAGWLAGRWDQDEIGL